MAYASVNQVVTACNNVPIPPCTHGVADGLLKWIDELELELNRTAGMLFDDGNKEASNQLPPPYPNSLHDKVAAASSRVSNLVGVISGLNGRLG